MRINKSRQVCYRMNFFWNVVIQTNDLTKDDVYYKSGRRHLLLYSRGDIRHITLDTYYC